MDSTTSVVARISRPLSLQALAVCFREISVKLKVRGRKVLNVFLRVLNRFKSFVTRVIVICYSVEDK